ncbi:hypothetical protein NE237_009143 [Protea cynaroides]|uniref:Uncharacterized protein n=1 Tax=Protea cynaroides TaxID=273540 RepID=A0A9Q0KX08_9MAGN|nr:hypothetical protein NE237_009143 [Protea cynaroides]
MTRVNDNWERLVRTTLQREQLCNAGRGRGRVSSGLAGAFPPSLGRTTKVEPILQAAEEIEDEDPNVPWILLRTPSQATSELLKKLEMLKQILEALQLKGLLHSKTDGTDSATLSSVLCVYSKKKIEWNWALPLIAVICVSFLFSTTTVASSGQYRHWALQCSGHGN